MRCGQQVSAWYVFENHAEWRMCLFLVLRLKLDERFSLFLWSVLFSAFALLRGLRAGRALAFLLM